MNVMTSIPPWHRFALAAVVLLACATRAAGEEPTADAVAALLKKPLQELSAEQLWRDGGPAAVRGLVDMIDAVGPGADYQPRLALHGVVIHVGRPGLDADRRRLVEALAATLEGERKATTKAVVIRELQHARGREAVAAIGKRLLDPELCEYATLALVSFADAPALAEFRRALPQATGRTRMTLLGGLSGLRDPASAEAFLRALGDADRDTRLVAAAGLAELGDARAGETLLQAATSADSIMQKGMLAASCLRLAQRLVEQGQAADAERFLLQVWKAPPDPANVNLRCGTLHELGRTGGDEAGKVLAEIVRGPDARLARAAARGMAGQAGREVTWFTSLSDAGEPVRAMFIEEVAARAPPALPAVVLAGLESPAVAVQTAALKAVRGEATADIVKATAAFLGHGDKNLVAAANAALCRISGKEPDGVLVAGLAGATPQATAEAFAVLATRLAREQVPAVIAGLASPEPGVRQAAAQAVGALGTDAHIPLLIETIFAAGSTEDRMAAGDAVVAVARRSPDRPQAVAMMLKSLDRATGPARAELVRDVGRVNEAGSLAALTKAIDDSDSAVRTVAVQALADWPDGAAIEPLRRVIKDSREPAHRSLAVRCLVRLLPAATEARIRAELESRSLPKAEEQAAFSAAYAAAMLAELTGAMNAAALPEDRKAVLQSLRNHPHATSLGLAKAALADADPVVRAEAEVCAVGIAERLGDAAATKAELIAVLETVAASSKDQGRVKRCQELLGKLSAKP